MPIEQGATNQFKLGMTTSQFDFNTDTFKMALYTGAANLGPTTAAYTATNETSGTGYSTGGQTLTVSTAPTVGPNPSDTIVYLSFSNVTWSPASFTCRGALIYKYDGVTNPTVCVLDFGSDKTPTTNFEVQFPAANNTNAIIRIT
jgi:hypothetical protein